MNRSLQLAFLTTFLVSGCGGSRLSHGEIRKQIADLGTSTLVPKAIEIRRVSNESGNRAIAETTVELAFQFERDTPGSPWHIAAVRLGDQNWLSIPELLQAVTESRIKVTTVSLQKLDAGVTAYRQRNGTSPNASTITALGDVLHPQYMKDLVMHDGWGHPIQIEASSPNGPVRFRSLGPDGKRGTSDDLLFPE